MRCDECEYLARLDMRKRRVDVGNQEHDFAAEETYDRLTSAFVGHLYVPCARNLLQHFDGDIARAARSWGPVSKLAWLALSQRNQCGQCLRRDRRMAGDDSGADYASGHRCEITLRTVSEALEEAGVYDERRA